RRLRRGLLQLGLRLLLGALLLHRRHVVEILPGDQHQARQNDGEDGIAVVGHPSRHQSGLRLVAGAGPGFKPSVLELRALWVCRAGFANAMRRSSSMVAKPRESASLRPTST